MGFALAQEAAARGASVDLVTGPVSLADPPAVRVHRVISAEEMFAACEPLFSLCDLFIAVAAVADFRPRDLHPEKVKKNQSPPVLELVPTVDILKTLAARKSDQQKVVGFAAETRDVESYARRKMEEKKLDWIVANNVSGSETGMNADKNTVIILSREGHRSLFGPALKIDVAKYILDTIGYRRGES